METIKMEEGVVNMNFANHRTYDVLVAGGGVAGVAAAVEAARGGKRVALVEKSTQLGGLATIGLINLFGSAVQRPRNANHSGHGGGISAPLDPIRLRYHPRPNGRMASQGREKRHGV